MMRIMLHSLDLSDFATKIKAEIIVNRAPRYQLKLVDHYYPNNFYTYTLIQESNGK